jgi:hypothetical protein
VRVARGDLAGALDAYTRSLEIAERLAAADPDNTGYQRGVWVGACRVASPSSRWVMPQRTISGREHTKLLSRWMPAADSPTVTASISTSSPENSARVEQRIQGWEKRPGALRADASVESIGPK